jgi:hypothetical protein
MTKLPSFFIIGAMKAATSTLWEQLTVQPGIFLCTPKEPNFFSDDDQYSKGIEYYRNLFVNAEQEDIVGEASTHYTKLPTYPDTIDRLSQDIKDPKFIYIIRHPVDRLISHYIHEWSQGIISCDIDQAVSEFTELIEYSCYYKQIRPYIDLFGKNKILLVFFDQLKNNSQSELERICYFLGYDKKPTWHNFPPQNVSAERIRKFPLYRHLVESSLATLVRRVLIPKVVRNYIKNSLTIKNRPTPSDNVLKEIVAIFNDDLKKLSEYLNIELNCNEFKEKASHESINWR